MNRQAMGACAERLEQFLSSLLAPVGRAERRQHGAAYIQGLLLDGERKSIEPMAARGAGGGVARGGGCRKVGIPEGTPFRTKSDLVLELIDKLLGWGLEAQAVLADVA